jgi:hypothetical protein
MREDGVAIISFQGFDLIFLKPTRGAKMKVARVLISQSAVLDFCTLAPIGSTVKVFLTEVKLSDRSKAPLKRGEITNLLQSIKKGDNRTTVDQVKGGQAALFGPSSGSRPNPFELKAELTNRG